jgi:hypothetical protein
MEWFRDSFLEHDLFGKPASTFPDRTLSDGAFRAREYRMADAGIAPCGGKIGHVGASRLCSVGRSVAGTPMFV